VSAVDTKGHGAPGGRCRIPERLEMTERHIGSEVIDHTATDVGAEPRERTGGRARTCLTVRGARQHGQRYTPCYSTDWQPGS
jgi:hypothetical protein